MLSKVDIRDFIEINRGLYGDDEALAMRIAALNALVTILEGRGGPTMGEAHRSGPSLGALGVRK